MGNIRLGSIVLQATSEPLHGDSDTHYHTHQMWTSNCHIVPVLMYCSHFLSLGSPQTLRILYDQVEVIFLSLLKAPARSDLFVLTPKSSFSFHLKIEQPDWTQRSVSLVC